jgi:mannose-6-phosphate isomerase-like protein (cupin superfamily)
MRRVVTGLDSLGKSTVVSDGESAAFASRAVPGMVSFPMWATLDAPSFDKSGTDPMPALGPAEDLPFAGETRFFCLQLPPDTVFAASDFDPAAAAAEQEANSPRFASHFEPDHPGFHATDSVDYHLVLKGPIWLELDDQIVELNVGDSIVQNGVRHAWRNKGTEPAILGIVWVGRPITS